MGQDYSNEYAVWAMVISIQVKNKINSCAAKILRIIVRG